MGFGRGIVTVPEGVVVILLDAEELVMLTDELSAAMDCSINERKGTTLLF